MPKTLADAFAAGPPANPHIKGTCKLGEIIKTHPEGNVIAETVANPQWSNKNIYVVLRNAGLEVSEGTIRNHRGGSCACSKKDKR